ncbi:MAG: DEAD/DEAH box helicase [Bdellovibrionota bacterium]|nr:DEAD/DEAH box helicase [Bdellovibrionota bacterium]
MNKIQKFFISLLNSSKDAKGYIITPSDYGTRFENPYYKSKNEKNLTNDKIKIQHVYLQMLNESGDAESYDNGFLVKNEIVCGFDENIRMLFELPKVWDGSFELKASGKTYEKGDFKLELYPIRKNGIQVLKYDLNGPFLILSNTEKYLPNLEQYKMLYAINQFHELPLSEKSEEVNLTTIYSLQQAKENGVNINMRHFENINVVKPEKIGIIVNINKDNSLELIPKFYDFDKIKPEEISNRLNEIINNNSKCIRIKNEYINQIIQFSDEQIRAIKEIINNKTIAPKDMDSFLKSPSAFLNAYLIDLDNGLSVRVHGSEEFKEAYINPTIISSNNNWFGDKENGQIIISINDIDKFIKKEKEIIKIAEDAKQAVKEGNNIIEHENLTILVNNTIEDIEKIKNKAIEHILNCKKEEKTQEKSNRKILSIDLNDDKLFSNINNNIDDESLTWKGELFLNDLLLTPYNYQIEGIRWITGHAITSSKNVMKDSKTIDGSLLADDMGLGKTFMTLASINVWQKILSLELEEKFIFKPILVVAPLSLLENWKNEVFKVFKKSIFSDIVILQSDADLKRFRTKEKHDSENNLALKIGKQYGAERLDIPRRLVLTTYNTLRTYQFSLSRVIWGFAVFDEAQAIKNPNAQCSRASKALNADFRLAVTGTPVENSLVDFWNIMDTVKPSLLDTFQKFRQDYMVPIEKEKNNQQIKIDVGKKIHDRVSNFMLRRTKEDKLSGLPKKNIYPDLNECNINLKPTMDGMQLKLYDKVIDKIIAIRNQHKFNNPPYDLRELILPSLIHLRQISLHPNLYSYHSLNPLSFNRDIALKFINESAKLNTLCKILNAVKSRNEKIIIFIINKMLQFDLAIALRAIYNLSNVPIINGDTNAISGKGFDRKSIIDEFQNKDGFGIIIMSPIAAGVGLNVVGVNNIVHLERHWNPAKEAQATDRVYRIGQVRDVNIYIPIVLHPNKVSFEANLDRLLRQKIVLKDAVIAPEEVKIEDFDFDILCGTKNRF